MRYDPIIDRRALLSGFLAGGAGLAFAGQACAFADPGPEYPALRAFVGGFVDARQLPGTLATVGRGMAPPTVIARGTLANDSAVAVNFDSLWRVYSMTKPITGLATMMLIEDGTLKLDQPLADILPEFATMKVLKSRSGALADTVPATQPITIRHLLTHTAGLGYALDPTTPLGGALLRQGVIAGQVSRMKVPGIDSGTPAPDLKSFAARLATMPLVAQPGTKWSYSAAFDLLGRVIEVASGMGFVEFLSRRLFVPLGMKSSFFQVPRSQMARLTTLYGTLGSFQLPIDSAADTIFSDPASLPLGGGGLVTSARDYDRFLAMLLGEGAIGGVRVMAKETARLAMSNLLPTGVDAKGTWIAGQGFGAGGRVTLAGSAQGEGIFGWSGAAGTIAWVDRGRGARVAGYAQYVPPNALDFQSAFPAAALRDFA